MPRMFVVRLEGKREGRKKGKGEGGWEGGREGGRKKEGWEGGRKILCFYSRNRPRFQSASLKRVI